MIWLAEHDGRSEVTVSQVDGVARRVVATLPASTRRFPDLALVVHPDRERVAVLVDDTTWVVSSAGDAPAIHEERTGSAGSSMRPVLAWEPGHDTALVAADGPRRSIALPDRWTLEVVGELEIDGGFSGGHFGHSASGGLLDVRTSPQLRLMRNDVVVALPSPAGGATTVLMWPPVVGPAGVLLRRAHSRRRERAEDVEAHAPWLVTADGDLSEVPVELGVSPLTALADGTWLLPGADPLWRDDYDEPLHVLDAEGRVVPFLLDGSAVRPSALVARFAPTWSQARDEEALWTFEGARLDATDGELRLLLTDSQLARPAPEPLRWLAVALPRAGGGIRLLASGTATDAAHIAIGL